MSINEFYEAETIAFRKKQKAEADDFEAQLKDRIVERFNLPKAGDKVTVILSNVTLKNVEVLEVTLHLPDVWVKIDTDAFMGIVDVPLNRIKP